MPTVGTSVAFQHLNLTIEPGEKLGIVGASGAGKSTLRFASAQASMTTANRAPMLIDGQDTSLAVTQDSLRRQIGMVTQETAMFNRSARDNILYGNPAASEDALIEPPPERQRRTSSFSALQDAQGRTGYEAHLGERGVKLSGGQRQRIALARAILKDAPILVLDEATSALDSEVEASIQTALHRVMEGKTVSCHCAPAVHPQRNGSDYRAGSRVGLSKSGLMTCSAGAKWSLRAILAPSVRRLHSD